ncbi:MAG TPA: porin family protein [Paludibacter sp.]|nr:porin family protein [Paludibacter sp.]
MRKLLISILLPLGLTLSAQVRLEKPELYLGANFGMTGSRVLFNPSVDQSFLPGYNGGLVLRYITEKNVAMQIELNYSQRGWAESGGSYARQLNYIELPFLTHLYVGDKGRLFFNLGPKISYLISEKVLYNLNSDATQEQHSTLIQNPFDYGLCAGFGYLFRVQKQVFQLDTRANFSLSDVFSNDKRDYFDTSNNMNASVNLAWLFQLH